MSSNNYVVYHLHSDDSLLDSCTKYKDYIDYAVSLGQKAIAFTEHGKPLHWVRKKQYCDEVGIKYIHGVECYLTRDLNEKVRDNFHTILLAKNYDGLLEINSLISRSTDEHHTYYVNRISFDEFLSISDNVIKISACLASPLNKLSVSDEMYDKLARHYDYYEIQPHNCQEQIDYNVHLAILSQRYNKPLIAGTDTHSLNKYKAECRKILLKYKNKSYGDEDTFDLTYKTYDELVKAFTIQSALTSEIFLEAIENTNKMAESVEDFMLDTSLKYPILYGTREKDRELFHKTIETKLDYKIKNNIIPSEQVSAFKEAIKEEERVFEKIQMDGFMLSMSELTSWCRDNNIPLGFARGSVGGSRIAYVTDIIDLNPETWHTIFSRFCNEDREEVGDIDIDVIESDRPKIFNYIIDRFGTDKTARVPAFGTMVDKSVIDCICGALNKYWTEENGDQPSPYSLSEAKKIKSEYQSNPQKTKEKYHKIFYYFDGLLDTQISQSIHPAGIVISPITLNNYYGVFHKDNDLCLMIDMDEIHDIGLVKYDFLVIKTLEIIRDTYHMIGKPFPLSHEIDWEDQNVWNDIIKTPTGIFQMEGEYAHSLLRQFEPKSIFDMSLVTAAIRPQGKSYRDKIMKHIPNHNPSELIDKLLENNLGYLVYQEDVIAFLQNVCGLSGSEADNVRRAIARKDHDRLHKALPDILNGYCKISTKPRNIAEQEAKEFLKIIEDAGSYMFGYNHSIAYCMIGYLCAYLRYYYPHEFITAYLNNAANDDDISSGTALAQEYKILISPPRFGISKDSYFYNETTHTIAKGIGSVKFLNASVSNELYELSKQKYDRFVDLLYRIKNETSLNSKQLEILIKIRYFSDFGNINELLRIVSVFDDLKSGTAVSISADKLNNVWYGEIVKKYSTNIGVNGNVLKKYTIKDMRSILNECEDFIKSKHLPEINTKNIMEFQKEYLGYIDLTTNNEADRRKLLIMEVIPLKNKQTDTVWAYAIFTRSVGSGKSARLTLYKEIFDKKPINPMNIIYAEDLYKNKSGYWYLQKYEVIE